MRESRLLVFVIVLGIVGGLMFGGIVGIGTAETDDELDEDPSDPSTVYAEVDDDVRVLSWEYDEDAETFEITLENDGSDRTRVSIMEIIDLDDGSDGPLGMREVTMRPGEEAVVEVGATLDSRSAGVIVMTEDSIESGQVTPIIYGSGVGSLFDGPSTWGLVQISGISGALGTFVFAVGFAWHRRAERTDKTEVKL